MKKIILFLSFLAFSVLAYSDDGEVHYFLEGKAFYNNELLKNEVFVMEMGTNEKVFKTNEKGEFHIKIRYYFPCPSGLVSEQEKYQERLLQINGTILQFYNRALVTELPNVWEKFKAKQWMEKDSLIEYQDLFFQKDNSCSSDFKSSIEDFKEKIAMMHEKYIDEWKRKLSTEKALEAGRSVFNTFSFLNMRKEEIFDLLDLGERCHLLLSESENEVFCGFDMGATIWIYTFRFENDKVVQVDPGIINF